MKFGWMRLALGTALVGAALSAQALTVTIDGWHYGSGQSVNVGVYNTTRRYEGSAGAFKGTYDKGAANQSSFVTYCVELEHSFNWNTTYSGYDSVDGATALGTAKAELLGKLMTKVGGMTSFVDTPGGSTASQKSGSLQLAIWEILYETGTVGDLGHGSFTNTNNTDINTQANTWLNNLSAQQRAYDISVLKHANRQDFLLLQFVPVSFQSDVPEPASWALAGMALAALGVARRRRA